jgi:lysophospholipase L1-like esterase
MISYGRLFFILGILGLACLGLTDADAQTPSTRFLPLGDSLTEGVSTLAFPGSYRNRLHQLLETAGFNVDFIGNGSDANNPTLPDTDHEGHGGFKIDQIQSGISSGWLDSVEDPDVILLLIGTNDFSANNPPDLIETRFSNLIADLATRRPFAKIIVSTLPPRTDDPACRWISMRRFPESLTRRWLWAATSATWISIRLWNQVIWSTGFTRVKRDAKKWPPCG